MKHIFFSILTALAFWHCKDPSPAPKNILNCYARFDVTARNLKAEATLQDGRTKQIIEMPGGIRFQSTEMKVLPVRGITYSVDFPASFSSEQVFEWKTPEGLKREFKMQMPSLDSFFFDKKVLSAQTPAYLQWVGTALDKGEILVMMWENTAEGKTVPLEVSTTLGEPLIEIPTVKMSQIGPGDWSLYLVRKRFQKAEVADFLVVSTAEFYSKPMLVKVEG